MTNPTMAVESGLDCLLITLPARNNFAFPLSVGYAWRELVNSGSKVQFIDADAEMYHWYHHERVVPPAPTDRRAMAADPWAWYEDIWTDPRCAKQLVALFRAPLDLLVNNICSAAPKTLAMSVHHRNEWASMYVADRVRRTNFGIRIIVGGPSCVHRNFGPRAFPKFDHMIIGECEGTLGPMVRALAAGGTVRRIVEGGKPVDLDRIGAPLYDWSTNLEQFRCVDGSMHPYVSLTRGCIWSRCTFCSERNAFRTRSAENFVNELETYYAKGIRNFCFSESDFGGQVQAIAQVAQRIIDRGLNLTLEGQLRVNKKFTVELLRLMVAAGIRCNFGIDAATEHTLKLQNKGYKLAHVSQVLKNCREAKMPVNVNLVVGVPYETEADVADTVKFLADHKDCITMLFNVSPYMLAHGSAYWDDPSAYGIEFEGDRRLLREKYWHGIPDRLWHSVNPYIDGPIRRRRALFIVEGAARAGIPVSNYAMDSITKPMFDGFWSPRDLTAERLDP